MAETEKPPAENLAAISAAKPEASSPAENKADTTSAEPQKTPDETKTPEISTELQEKKVKQAFLDRFRHKKTQPDPNTNDTDGKPELSAEQTAQALYKELAQIKGSDYWVFRVRKKTLLLLAGFGIVIMWLGILGGYLIKTYKPDWVFWRTAQGEAQTEIGPTATPAPESLIRIRIRDNHSDPQVSRAITDLLHNKGYQQVEIVDDHASEYSGIMIITKREELELNQLMHSFLKDTYTISSPSAELTADSDFQVVILVGNDTNQNQATTSAVID